MNVRLLIDGIVRQTIEAQGVGRKVVADRFGMALRAYQRKIQRLDESATDRNRTLWQAVLGFLGEGSQTRGRILERFQRDGEREVGAVLNDLVTSGLVYVTGRGISARYGIASESDLHAVAASEDLRLAPGAVIAKRYQLERCLGQGGMGVVWAAVHTVTRKKVALKFLKGPVHLRPELRRRFLREARAASAVVHPNVLEVRDVFELDDDTPVMLMDLLDGETLGARIARLEKLSLSETADILIQVVSAVSTAHAVGVVHRDLKPDNVFLVGSPKAPPSVRVLDFGIAKLVGPEGPTAETGIITGTGSMVGTPCYMSPEQSFGEKAVDYRTDIWSLGVLLYECLTGARPVEGVCIGQVVKRLVTDGITPISVVLPSIPRDLATLIDGMLAREREQRTQDLREVSTVLSHYTNVRPPEFGAAESERRAPDPEQPSQPSNAGTKGDRSQKMRLPEATCSQQVLRQARQPGPGRWRRPSGSGNPVLFGQSGRTSTALRLKVTAGYGVLAQRTPRLPLLRTDGATSGSRR